MGWLFRRGVKLASYKTKVRGGMVRLQRGSTTAPTFLRNLPPSFIIKYNMIC